VVIRLNRRKTSLLIRKLSLGTEKRLDAQSVVDVILALVQASMEALMEQGFRVIMTLETAVVQPLVVIQQP
jgi:hypothetical protein